MKNLVVTLIIAIAVMASFSQVQAQTIGIIGIGDGDEINISNIGYVIDEERKIYVQVEDGNTTDGKGKIHFKLMNTDNYKNKGSYNLKEGEGVNITFPEDGSTWILKVIKIDEDIPLIIS